MTAVGWVEGLFCFLYVSKLRALNAATFVVEQFLQRQHSSSTLRISNLCYDYRLLKHLL